MKPLLRALLGALLLGIASAQAGVPSIPPGPPTILPAAVKLDLTAPIACPLAIIPGGQSNAVGNSPDGSKTVGANILIANDKDAPTAYIPAQYGVAPLNVSASGTTSDPAQAFKNPAEAIATELRSRNLIPASRPIVLIPDAEGAQPISDWVDGTPYDMWARLGRQLALFTATYPGCTIDLFDWDQGENDSGSSGYNSQAAYIGAFDRLVAKVKALSVWDSHSLMLAHELGTWADNAGGQARNDAIRMIPGRYGNQVDTINSVGQVETTVAGLTGPHRDGPSMQRDAVKVVDKLQAFAALRGAGRRDLTYYGSALSFPNSISVGGSGAAFTGSISGYTLTVASAPTGTIAAGQILAGQASGSGIAAGSVILAQLTGSTGVSCTTSPGLCTGGVGTYSEGYNYATPLTGVAMFSAVPLNEDDCRSGCRVTLTGGYVLLPSPSLMGVYPMQMTAPSVNTTLIGNLSVANLGNQPANTVKAGENVDVRTYDGGAWKVNRAGPSVGDWRWYTQGGLMTGAQTLNSGLMSGDLYSTTGTTTITMLGPTYGNNFVVYDTNGATTINAAAGVPLVLPDGTTATTLSLTGGQQVMIRCRISAAAALECPVMWEHGVPAVHQALTAAQNYTVPNGMQLVRLTQASTIASATLTLPAVIQDGSPIQVTNYAGPITALSFSPAVTGWTNGSALAANTGLRIRWDVAAAAWQKDQ